MPLYTSYDDVRIRLLGKVRFTDQESETNLMYKPLAIKLIDEGEGQLELDLSPRYFAPFGDDGGAWSGLPDRPTKQVLKTLAEAQGVMKILDTDFGRSTVVDGSNYYKAIEERYKRMVNQLLEYRGDIGGGWKYPPLPGLKLNYQNAAGDDGFQGTPMIAGSGADAMAGEFAASRVNDPSKSFWWGAWPGWNGP